VIVSDGYEYEGAVLMKTIFVVDDNDTNLTIAKDALKEHYNVMTMPSAAKMFALTQKLMPDLILLDIQMPVMDGFEALKQLKNDSVLSNIPVIFLTSSTDTDVEARGFLLGVADFISKPFSAPVLMNRIKYHLDIDGMIRERTAQLQKKTEQLLTLQHGIVFVLADMVENRDKNTGGHVERTTSYINILIHAMLEHKVYDEEISGMDIDLLVSSARLHDVGKISISDTILNKPGKLTDEEFEIMKTHCAEGERIIGQIVTRTEDGEFLRNAILFAGYHHERWDGKGYPHALAEMDIPLLGRVMAVVDVYDALASERPYKRAFSHEEAVNIIMDCSGTQFDPRIVNLFFEVNDQFAAIQQTRNT